MAEDTQASRDSVRDMAAQIYTQIIDGALTITGDSANISANPESLAKISFKLAEAFHKVEGERHAAAKPVNAVLDLDKLDFG